MPDSAEELDRIRARIDEIDTGMHELLLERGGLIERLRAVKGVAGGQGTTAMRPAREAQMMNAIAARHSGPLPLAVVERIWREIIAGFTQLQAPFKVALAGSDDAALVEMGRYYFGVTTPLSIAADAQEILDLVASDESAVGVIADCGQDRMPWWVMLARASGNPARVVARLPFFAARAGGWAPPLNAFVLSRAPVMPSGRDRTLVAASRPEELEGAALVESHGAGADALHLLELAGCRGAEAFSGSETAVRWLGGYGVAQDNGGAA